MSELLPPQAPSVVLDVNATVKVRRWPALVGALAAVAFVAYFVLALVIDDSESYVMGPAASSLQEKYAALDTGESLDSDELRCIDDAAEGIDTAFLDQMSGGVLTGDSDDPIMKAFTGRVMDDCMRPASRQAIMASEMTADGTMTSDEAACLAEVVDGAVMDIGGYTQMMDDPTGSGMMLSATMLGALGQCGLSMADMMGG